MVGEVAGEERLINVLLQMVTVGPNSDRSWLATVDAQGGRGR
jgi:hypothetical protein